MNPTKQNRTRYSLKTEVVKSHKRIVLSWLLLASVFPSGEYAIPPTDKVCPARVLRSSPVCGSHKPTVALECVLARVFPSGENAMAYIRLVSDVIVLKSFPVCGSHNLMVLSFIPLLLAIVFPSGENATE